MKRHSMIGQAPEMTNSPTLRLLLGLLITLAAVAGFSSYTLFQLDGSASCKPIPST